MRNERPVLSKKNPYYIPKQRYYELKHFCLQYNDWKRTLTKITGWKSVPENAGAIVNATPANPTEQLALLRAFFSCRIEMLEHCAVLCDPVLAPYILLGVTEGLSYEILRTRGCPCCKDIYYNLYRRFFWVLSRERA